MRMLLRLLRWLMLALVFVAVGGWWAVRPTTPDAFFEAPASLSGRPGTLLRQAPFSRKVPAGTRGWRILYTTTRGDGAAALASAIVMVSDKAPPGRRPVIAWTHGTTGVAAGCAPSLLDDPFANVPALQPLLDQGWIYVATDYVGQGTAGPPPYLIGEDQARSALDSVRAARQLRDVGAGEITVVWGHSQGGHAALWTGILAPSYAPDVPLAGVAALAPASDLRSLIDRAQHTPVGRIMSSFVLRAYSQTYPDVKFGSYTGGLLTQALADDMASRCLAGPKALFSVAEALLVGGSIFASPPDAGALGERLAQNTPARPLPQALLIAQGLSDDLVLPDIQAQFVSRRCKAGQALEFRRYAERDHLSLVAPDSPLTGDLIRWTRDRIDGVPVPPGCSYTGG